jgi:hypothetical protein
MRRTTMTSGSAARIWAKAKEDRVATYTLKDLWRKACEHDGIDPTSKFVVFSKDNPWIVRYNNLMLALHSASTNEACELLNN